MPEITVTPAGRRPWREVAKEQGWSWRYLGEKIGRSHATVRGYACGQRRVPKEVLDKMSELFEEPVR